MNMPHLYFRYLQGEAEKKIGPYFSARQDGVDVTGFSWMCYQVVDKNGNCQRISVPWFHTIEAFTYSVEQKGE